MVVRMAGLGRSFRGVTDYCLHDQGVEGEPHPESSERVGWTETHNLATSNGERAARIMAATAEAGGELKRLAGVAATGRKLEKPVCHYSLNWAKEEKPERGEMGRAVEESLKALGMEGHQALIVAHNDGHPHVHVIVNRVNPESGKAAGLSRSKLKLSRWAEGYEREQGKIQCRQREINNDRRSVGGVGCRWPGSFGGAVAAGADEPASRAAGKDSGGAGRLGAGLCRLASGGGAEVLGVLSAAAWEGAWGTGEAEQGGVVGALRASGEATGADEARLPRSPGALPGLAGAGRGSAGDWRSDPGTHRSTGALP